MTAPPPSQDNGAHIVTGDGVPVVTVRAVIARFRAATTRGDIEQACQVLALISGEPASGDQNSDLAVWQTAVVARVLAAPDGQPTVIDAEAAHLEAFRDSQGPYRAAFTEPVIAPDQPARSAARAAVTWSRFHPSIER